jgi:hypothetical protein
VLRRARAIAEQRDNFAHRQRMIFSPGVDVLSNAARQVAARLALSANLTIDESLEAVPISSNYGKFFPIQLKFPPQIYRVCFSIWMSWTVGVASQPWIPAGERSGLLTHIATTESVSLCERMKSWQLLSNSNQRFSNRGSVNHVCTSISVACRFSHFAG